MTTYLLFRHGNNDAVGNWFAGRSPGVHLNEEGRRQAARIAERFGSSPIKAIYSSPLERAIETASPLAERLGVPVQTHDGLIEVGAGDWTRRRFDEMSGDEHWTRFNALRSSTRAPNGELALETQARMVDCMEEWRVKHPGETIALFSHADVIKAALLLYAGIPLDFINRFAVFPAAVSVITLDEANAQVLRINDTGLAFDFASS
jgi:probable phosphoglycerate mutase